MFYDKRNQIYTKMRQHEMKTGVTHARLAYTFHPQWHHTVERFIGRVYHIVLYRRGRCLASYRQHVEVQAATWNEASQRLKMP